MDVCIYAENTPIPLERRSKPTRPLADLLLLYLGFIRNVICYAFLTSRVHPYVRCSPLLAHILDCAAESETVQSDHGSSTAVSGGGSGVPPLSRVVSSSCHDVTILALLYAMESHLIVSQP